MIFDLLIDFVFCLVFDLLINFDPPTDDIFVNMETVLILD